MVALNLRRASWSRSVVPTWICPRRFVMSSGGGTGALFATMLWNHTAIPGGFGF